MDPYLLLTNRLFETILAHTTCLDAWGIYLFNKDFDCEPGLRNKAGTIWICSLLDTLEADERFIPAVEKEAAKHGFQTLVDNCQQVKKFCAVVADLLGMYTRDEQLYLIGLRNQWVHGYGSNRYHDQVSIKYCQLGKMVTERVPREEYHELLLPFYKSGLSVDATLQPLVNRALDLRLPYWRAVKILREIQQKVYDVMRARGVIRFTGLEDYVKPLEH